MIIDGYEVSNMLNAKWLKIFFHNSTNKTFFDYSTKEAFYSISNPNKYSLMKLIPRVNRYEKEKYEFLLEYPGHIGYNRWSQRMNPLSIVSRYTGDIGFEEIELTWKGYLFSGLSRFYDKQTHFSCSTNSTAFHYSIGAYQKFGFDENYFAGPRIKKKNTETA